MVGETTVSGKKREKFREPVEHVVFWPGKRMGVDLINILTLGTVLVPSLVVLVVIFVVWNIWVSPFYLLLFLGGVVLGGLGISVGYHRLFTHASFEAKPWVRYMLGILASINVQGPLLFWCSCHRAHHQHSDRDGDPHSPHLSGSGKWNKFRGMIHAHFGWIVFAGNYGYNARRVRDLYNDPVVRRVDDLYLLWVFLGLAIPALLGWLWTGTPEGAVLGFFWGGLVRVAFTHHVTWSVNSFGHKFGSKPFQTNDESRNNYLLALVGMGEGWHNNHHAFPQSARHGIDRGQTDMSFSAIKVMEKLGWIWNVRDVNEHQKANKRKRSADEKA